MRSLFLALVAIILFSSARAQTFEEKVSVSSCECVGKEKAVVDSIITKCITRSMLQIAMDDSTNQYMKLLSTIEGVQKRHKAVRKRMVKLCNEKFTRPKDE